MSSRKRRISEAEEGEMVESEDDLERISDEEGSEDEYRRRRSSKKSGKKKKKKHKHHHHHKKRKRSKHEDHTDDERGGSTPEINDQDEHDERRTPTPEERRRTHSPEARNRRKRTPPSPENRKSTRSPENLARKSNAEQPKRKSTRSPDDRKSPEDENNSSKHVESLSIEETNKLRASLGLAPLKINTDNEDKNKEKELKKKADEFGGELIPNSRDNEIHIPAKNLGQLSEADKIRERIKQRRLKRELESKLLTLKTLAEDDEEDSRNWVEKQKKLQKEKEEAKKRAKMLEDLDDEFGVSDLVEEKQHQPRYSKKALKGLKVQHAADKFQEGKSVILTLKDADVLGEEDDTLVNVNMVDDELVDKRKDEIKKAKVGYNAYEQEEVDELTGEIKKKSMLDKYDEEEQDSFVIGQDGDFNEDEEKRKMQIRAKLKMKLANKNMESLAMPAPKLASDYYTVEESAAKFKKPKKKKKVKRRTLKADDLLDNAEQSFGSRNSKKKQIDDSNGKSGAMPMDIDEEEEDIKPNIMMNVKVDDDEDDEELANALQRTRRQRQKEDVVDRIMQVKQKIKEEQDEDMTAGSEFIPTFEDDQRDEGGIILNETAEFCRNLGARQMSLIHEQQQQHQQQQSDSEDEGLHQDLAEFEASLKSNNKTNNWEEVKYISSDEDDEKRRNRETILDEEPDLQQGVAAAIKLAESKGYWEKDEKKKSGSSLKHLQAKNYSIDDKMSRGDDERGSSRNRHERSGPTTSFAEKKGYVPNVKLEYIDDNGRRLNSKEAFRHLSHKFHGKGSGKMKTEKRMKKMMEEGLMKNMASTDTPLQTLDKLRRKQEECATPYVVLSGNKINQQDLKKL